MAEIMTVENAVKDRYSEAARTQEAALCCPVDYNQEYLDAIPEEIIEVIGLSSVPFMNTCL